MTVMNPPPPRHPRDVVSDGVDPQALSTIATLARHVTRLAGRHDRGNPRSPWLDVVTETVTITGYLTAYPDVDVVLTRHDHVVPAGGTAAADAGAALRALEEAAAVLDAAGGRRDHVAVLLRAALSRAVAAAGRLPS